MSPNLYDLLDVDETATAAEVRAAWKTSVADLDPTDRRFRAYNDAAAVLLDVDKRAAYDARLADERADEPDEPDEAHAVVAGTSAVAVDEPEGTAGTAEADEVGVDRVEADEVETDEPETDEPETDEPETDEIRTEMKDDAAPAEGRSGPSVLLLWVVAALALLAVVGAVWVLTLPGVRADASPKDVAETAQQLSDTGAEVQTVATEEIVPLLGYDYRTMDEDLTRIQSRMTEAMGDRQAASWQALTKEAKAQRVVVTARAPYVALTRLSEDGERATVVAFIDQDVTKRGAEPFTLQMWATLTLVESDGEWLLDDICTEGDCS